MHLPPQLLCRYSIHSQLDQELHLWRIRGRMLTLKTMSKFCATGWVLVAAVDTLRFRKCW